MKISIDNFLIFETAASSDTKLLQNNWQRLQRKTTKPYLAGRFTSACETPPAEVNHRRESFQL